MEIRTALVCIAKGENRYIREWCEWHRGIGFDEIYIYDNNLVGERIDEAVGDLPYVHINNRYRNALQRNVEIQLKCYNEWYRAHRGDFTHFAFLDCDEFLNVSDDFNGLKDYIARVVRNAEGTRLYWKCHSDSGNLHYEDKPVRERFPQVVEPKDGRYFYKMLFSTRREEFKMINVHFSNHLSNIIDCNGKRINYSQSTYTRGGVAYDCAWVDHYITKSAEEYFRNKRGKKDDARRLTVGFFFNFNEHTEEKDRYVAEIVGIDVATVAKSNAGALEVHIDRKPETVVLDGMLKDTVKVLPQKQAEALKAVAEQEPKPEAKTAKSATVQSAPAQVGEYPEGVSVCISAYQTQDYIEECLDSVEAQTWFKSHSNWEVLLGIDGCEKTLEKVRSIMHKYRNLRVFMMDENVGTYVTCNTIMKEAKYKWLLRFDSDDVMPKDMIEKFYNKQQGKQIDVFRVFYHNFGKKNNQGIACGVHFVRHEIWNEYGGYRKWRISADYDFLHRIGTDTKSLTDDNVFYNRRVRDNSLEHNTDTNMQSELRKTLNKFVVEKSRQDKIIECSTTKYKAITLNAIISLTSWKARIGIAHKSIESLFKMCPNYHIVLVLSKKEFPNQEKELPQSILTLVDTKGLEILWVNENYKAFKKVLPTIEKYGNVPIISADDDVAYTRNYADELYQEWCKDKSVATISYRHDKMVTNCGAATLYNPIYFDDLYGVINENIVNTNEDDMFFQFIIDKCHLKQRFMNKGFPFTMTKNGTPALSDTYKQKSTPQERLKRNSEIYAQEFYKNAPVHINITTWKKRDHCLPVMLSNLTKQTRKPDRIILWLSSDEYDKDNLPEHIIKCLNDGLLSCIKWIPKNIYGHKKQQCFKYYNYCYNIELDDDTLYKPNIVNELITQAKLHTDCITVYSTTSVKYVGNEVIKSKIAKTPSEYNAYMGGRNCFPPFIYPFDAYEKSELRDKYVTKCDEGWLRPYLMKHHIKINALHDWDNSDYPAIKDSQTDSLWNENKRFYKNGMREKERNFFNGIKIVGVENEAKRLWSQIGIDKWQPKTKDEM